jgi:hypothetical protein
MLSEQVRLMQERAAVAGTELLADAYLVPDAADGGAPWPPGAVTLYFGRPRSRAGPDHLNFHSLLRKFMETYGQDLGFSPVQVARTSSGTRGQRHRSNSASDRGVLSPRVASGSRAFLEGRHDCCCAGS